MLTPKPAHPLHQPRDLYSTRDCRACGGTLDSVLHLGDLVLPDYLGTGDAEDDTPERTAPLDWCACASCRLVQLRHTVDPSRLFERYWYQSGINEAMVAELHDIVVAAQRAVGGVGPGAVIDIGANDGTLLSLYPPETLRFAVEPARNLQDALHQHAHIVAADYFPSAETRQWPSGDAKIITSIATFYATDNPHAYLAEVARLLHPTGVWVVQFQDLYQMLQKTAFDNITWEHLFYPSLADLEGLCADAGLCVVDAEIRAINGGSYRLVVQHRRRNGTPNGQARVNLLRRREVGCQSWEWLEAFAWRVEQIRRQITGLIDHLTRQGQTVDLYAASTKSSTLLQYCGLDATVIRQCWERSPEKIGRRTSGTRIPIVSEADGRANPPSALLVGAWQFREAFLQREVDYLRQGGAMIFPLPACDVVRAQP